MTMFQLNHYKLSALAVLLGVACGCHAPGYDDSASEGWDISRLKFWERRDDDLADTSGINGPIGRLLKTRERDRQRYNASLAPLEGQPEFDAAKSLYDQGEFSSAESEFKRLARAYPDTPIEEDSLFFIGECQFAREKYPAAQDSYAKLMKKYPSPRQLDLVTKRLFKISQVWLQFPQMVASGDVQQVNFENPKTTPPPEDPTPKSKDPSRTIPVVPNLFDRTRPVFDTEGRALEALRSIWLNDPTGPLADDALMLTASHYLRKGDYLEADRVFTILREQYPKSQHLENAFILGSHVRLMSYQGEMYDGTSLKEAGELKESTLRLYPKHPERERMLDEVRRIEEAKAAREWENVVFWNKKNKPLSVAMCCREVIRLYPNSKYAAMARETLAEIGQQ